MNERILLVEDDVSVRESLQLLLERSGFSVFAVADGRAALHAFADSHVDLVLLDLMLPSLDGIEVCRTIRRTSNVPVIMLTARSDATDVVVGLELGADDYVTKPFDPKVLVARIRVALRRQVAGDAEDVIWTKGLEIDVNGFRASLHGEDLQLTAMEFKLLAELAKSAGRALSRDDLLNRVWGYDYLGDSRLVDMAVKRLRDKLGDDAKEPTFITTVRGHGYRFER